MGFLAAATFAGAALAPLTGALGFDGRAASSAARRRAASALRSRAASSLAACAESARELAVRSPRGGASEPCPPCRSARDQSWSAAASRWSSQRRKRRTLPLAPFDHSASSTAASFAASLFFPSAALSALRACPAALGFPFGSRGGMVVVMRSREASAELEGTTSA